jgi:hypothetical protein
MHFDSATNVPHLSSRTRPLKPLKRKDLQIHDERQQARNHFLDYRLETAASEVALAPLEFHAIGG